MNKRTYVCGFMLVRPATLVLLRKNKPEYQQGLLNGVGGSIETGETHYQAMVREWQEEIGWYWREWTYFCKTEGNDWVVHCYKSEVDASQVPDFPVCNDVGEMLVFPSINDLHGRNDLGHDLKYLMPMAFSSNKVFADIFVGDIWTNS